MNPLSLFTTTKEERRLAEQASRREWAATAVHIALTHPSMTRTKPLWSHVSPPPDPGKPNPNRHGKPLLAVLNVPQWPMPKHLQPAVRFLDLNQLKRGKSQWLGKRENLPSPLDGSTPQDSLLYGIPEEPQLKILCLTPPGWGDCYTRSIVIPDFDPAIACIQNTLERHGLRFKGLILTTRQGLDL